MAKNKKDASKNAKDVGTHGSLKAIEQKRKQVYKPVLENPYIRSNNWPHINQSLGSDILELICQSLEPIGKYKKYKSKSDDSNFTMEVPEISDFVTIGFNSTNKALEEMSKSNRSKLNRKQKLTIGMVFVCKVDITPALLTQHLPMLVYMALSQDTPVKLVQLPRHSMERLSNAVGRQLVGIVGISDKAPGMNVLKSLVGEQVEDVKIPWLEKLNFQVPNIKLLVTSQPVVTKKNDQKAANKKNQNV